MQDHLGLRTRPPATRMSNQPQDEISDLEQLCTIFPGTRRAPRRAFWELFPTTGEPSLWANLEGLPVVLPTNVASDGRACIPYDEVYDRLLEFAQSGAVGWLHVAFPLADWGGPLQLPEDPCAREVFLRGLSLTKAVMGSGGMCSREAPWGSGPHRCQASVDFDAQYSFATTQVDYCVWRRWRRTTGFASGDSLMQSGHVICPGTSAQGHQNLSLRGKVWTDDRWVSRALLASVPPIPVSRRVARCAARRLFDNKLRDAEDVPPGTSSQVVFPGTLCAPCSEEEDGLPWTRLSANPIPEDFPPVPAALVEKADWKLFKVRPWRDVTGHITKKEPRANVYAYEAIACLPGSFGTRVPILGDNEGGVHLLNKGRSSDPSLLRICRHSLAIAVATRTRPRWRHLEGHRQPCDGPTRPAGLTNGAAAAFGARSPGPYTATCLHRCPPGLCRCN